MACIGSAAHVVCCQRTQQLLAVLYDEIMRDIRALTRDATLAMEPGHGTADEALPELVRGYSTSDFEEGPSG